ncbi:Gfo/Idh/MocA family oxidoreductase [Roseiconus nitratireducens]|uniref:Gfo/Idh/MocA family oxidoreductase n=1 Tax=Roseiconus nitratireducens TaxID=2605748 RepID=A0A5M6DLL6_9BACT|nr:Gfo/Idh/MocA family oxidoreductase [Roseiconus nitratireducens]KAA5547296.1 Gfo/Idh/MocA family oxidoreductase [Roseiconus nitratireducens]
MPNLPARTCCISRRRFAKSMGTALGAAAGFHFFPSLAQKRLEKPTLAGIGAGGKGRTDIEQAKKAGFEVVALVDVIDAKKLDKIEGRLRSMAQVRESFPDAAFYSDYREMLDELGDRVDAVTVSTPDHHHFHASVLAMQAGKHVYCQKPLSHGIWEARTMNAVAKQTGMKTQMGNQAHANDHLRRCVELIRSGVIGKVKEIHAWTNRPIWPQGFHSPPPKVPTPAGIDWNQWVGPAPWVDYSPRIAPFAWRGWWDYGTGALGDMACHIMDLGFWAMNPEAPRSVRAQQQGATEISPPINSIITWEFGPTPYSAAEGFTFQWYDGYIDATFDRDSWSLKKNGDQYNHPDDDVLEGMSFRDYGSVIVGSEGKLFFHRAKNNWQFKPNVPTSEIDAIPTSLPRAPQQNSYLEWLAAIEGHIDQAASNFSLASPMTETILLGVLAQRFPDTRLSWDAQKMEVPGRPELNPFIRREYRDGWQIQV